MLLNALLIFLFIALSPLVGKWLAHICSDELKPGKASFKLAMRTTSWSMVTVIFIPLLLLDYKSLSLFFTICAILHFFLVSSYNDKLIRKKMIIMTISYMLGIILFFLLWAVFF